MNRKVLKRTSYFLIIGIITITSCYGLKTSVLQQAYPQQIQAVTDNDVIWSDRTKMPIGNNEPHKSQQEKMDSPTLRDQLDQAKYPVGYQGPHFKPQNDPGRIRYIPFFEKIYGSSNSEVLSHLTTIYWMPKTFGKRYPLEVTKINAINEKLVKIAAELDNLVVLHPEFIKYLDDPGGTFYWRTIANTKRSSLHSYGIAIDINDYYSDYWQKDLKTQGKPINEALPLQYKNSIPKEIIAIFEKYGFIWGGKWYHYDTMHFEYRPELINTH